MDGQLSIPMPVIAQQVTLQSVPGRGWVVTLRVLRQDQGWQIAGRWQVETRDAAELAAVDALAYAWTSPALD